MFPSPPWWVNVIVIVIVAITFVPLQRWLQSRINVLIYGEHDDPYALISQVNQQLQQIMSPQMTLRRVVELIALALKLPYVRIEMLDAESPLQIEFGTHLQRLELTSFPLSYMDKTMGVLHVSARGSGESLSNSDVRLLRDVARQAGIALYAVQLTADLQRSREQLVLAREEERRRIRNDLHDGLAPTLSSLQLQLGSTRALVRQNPDQAEAIVSEMREDLRSATAAIRELVYNLRPPLLDELGLVGAIKSFKFPDSHVRFEVTAPEPMPKLPAAVEVAVYRIASEAVHNVVKHARATRCVVMLEVANSYLKLSVTDDGKSLPQEYILGVGLHSMQERAAELGGTLFIQPCESGGTCLVAQFPMAV